MKYDVEKRTMQCPAFKICRLSHQLDVHSIAGLGVC